MKLLTNSRILDSFWRHWVTIALVSTLRLLLFAPQIHAADGSETAGQIRDANLNSIVFISVKAQRSNGLIDAFAGTGFIVHPAGYVLTCNHVVPAQNSDYIHIEMTGSVGGRYKYPYPLTIVRRDEQGDVILLKLPEDEVWHNVRSAGEGHIGSDIITFGFPFEQDLLTVPGSITGVNNDGKWITNASLNSGMSGGPAFDRSGNVVGIVAGGYNEASAINLLLRISSSNSLLESVNSPLLPIKSTTVETATPTEITPITHSPSPSSTVLSQSQVQALWNVIIYRVGHSQLVDSYVPDQLHAAQLINATRDNEDVQKLIEHFENQIKDEPLQKWFISVHDTFDALQADLKGLDVTVLQFPDVIKLNDWQKRQLQTAEYSRVNLLGILTQITLQLKLTDPLFANNVARTVPPDTPTSLPTVTPVPTSTPAAVTSAPSSTRRSLNRSSAVSYALTTTKDPVQPGKLAQFTITVTNLSDSKAFAEFAFHVPEFTTYRGYAEGTPSSVALGSVAPGASASANLDFKVLGGNQSPPDGSIVTLVLTDLSRGASVSHSVVVSAAPMATLDLSTQQGTVAPGEAFDYLLAYHNASGNALVGTQLSMPVPVGASLVSTDGGGVLGSDQVVHWQLGALTAGTTGQIHLNLKASTANGDHPALLLQAELRDGGERLLAQASAFKSFYFAPTFSYALTTTKDRVQPGKVAQFTITVTNLTDSKAFAEFAFHVPEFTTYRGYAEGTPSSVALGSVAPGASASANLDFKVLGGNRSPPDGSIVTLVLSDLSRGASVSHSVAVNQKLAMLRHTSFLSEYLVAFGDEDSIIFPPWNL